MKDQHDLYWIWLADKFGIASKEFPSFADKFSDPYEVYRFTEEEIEHIEGISDRLRSRLCNKSLESAYSIVKYCRKYGVDVIGYNDATYPTRLKTIENPPVLLYCLGEMPNFDSRLCIAMVGTRKMSEYGKQTAYKMAYELASADVCVVSGMALGIDGVCACGALEAGGTTVAVLGCGMSFTYPREHEKLKKYIIKQGAVITEYPPFEQPQPHNFPKRNRIISGLCQGVVVVEGAKGSGALITAARAVAQGRELFAIPGKVDESNSDGPNDLIREGANVALCTDDIIRHYDFLYHDDINYRGLYIAKRRSDLGENTLKRYGVCAAQPRRRFEKRVEQADEMKIGGFAKQSEPQKSADVSVNDTAEPNKVPDTAVYDALDATTKRVYDLIPEGQSVTADVIAANGVNISEVVTALTMLEISGLIASAPGGAFKRV